MTESTTPNVVLTSEQIAGLLLDDDEGVVEKNPNLAFITAAMEKYQNKNGEEAVRCSGPPSCTP